MTGQQLRNSILQEAIHGRLVPNVLQPGEKTGEELLKDILTERQKKENAEKGKKAKKLTLSVIEEEPWELPEGWCWCKLGDLSERLVGKTPERANAAFWTPGNMPWVSIADMQDYGEVVTTKESVSAAAEKDVFHNRVSKKGSLIMSFKLTVGRTCILGIDAYHNEAIVTFLLPEWLDILKMYLFWLLPVFTNSSDSKDAVKGKTLNKDSINATDIPLPPISIQKAIVAKIEELLPLIDEYDKAAGELETLNKALPDKLRKSVLQEAIHGTLVPNDILEGEATGAELLQQILKERQDKENKEKGKKAKKLTLSTIEEEPWEVPKGWCWCNLGDVGEFIRGNGIKKDEVIQEGYPCVRYGELYTRYKVQFSNVLSHVNEVVYNKSQKIEGGDVVMALTGENEYDIALAAVYLGTIPVAMGGDMTKLHPFIDSKYLVYLINSPYGIECKSLLATGQIIVHISNDKLASIQIPLPPLSVQHRIVEKIEEVFAAIDLMDFK